MHKGHITFGKQGEAIARQFLEKSGFTVVCQNYTTRPGEIDIVALEKGTVCFVEVKTRASDAYGYPQEAITVFKKRKMAQVAQEYILEHDLNRCACRFDVVSIIATPDGIAERIELIRNAFGMEEL